MKNIDITEWMLDNHIDSDTEIVMDGKQFFLADVLEKHLKEQFAISDVVLTSKAESLHETLANCHPSISRGKVWCRTCGRKKKVNPAESMRTGWAKCCGYTMTIDHPDTW